MFILTNIISIVRANINVKKKIIDVVNIYGYNFVNVYSIKGSIISLFILSKFSSFLHSTKTLVNICAVISFNEIKNIILYFFLI